MAPTLGTLGVGSTVRVNVAVAEVVHGSIKSEVIVIITSDPMSLVLGV
jgi:hypothetical protein